MKKIFLLSLLCTGLFTTMPLATTALNSQGANEGINQAKVLVAQGYRQPRTTRWQVICRASDQVLGDFFNKQDAIQRMIELNNQGICNGNVEMKRAST
jgi:hypothetical protein